VSTATEERLSTAPVPSEEPAGAAGRRRTPLAWVRLGWRRLTSMRTALQLLFVLSLAAVPGGLLPQRGQALQAVTAYLATHHTLGPLLDRLSLFDVFAAPWFAAVYLLLFTSLVGCLVPRVRAHARALRRPPPAVPSRLTRFAGSTSWSTTASPAEVQDAGRAALRGWRVRADGTATATALSAERGYLRETGNLVFHIALLLLLVGVGLGSTLGYESDRVLVEGDPHTGVMVDTVSQLDQFRPGRFVSASDLPAWRLALDSFDAVYLPGGTPKSYDAHVTFTPADGPSRAVDVRVNHPLGLGGGAKLYLLNHGYAPTFRLTGPQGQVLTDQAVCRPLSPQTGLASCTAAFRVTPPDQSPHDLAFEATLAPTGSFDPTVGLTSVSPALDSPDVLVAAYVGDLGASGVDTLDHRLLRAVRRDGVQRVDNIVVRGTADRQVMSGLPGGWTLDVPRVDEWASFQVKADPGKPLVLLAAVLIVAGLLASLRVRRRRAFLRATPSGDGTTHVEVAGLARSDAPASRTEFDSLVARLRRDLPQSAPPTTSR